MVTRNSEEQSSLLIENVKLFFNTLKIFNSNAAFRHAEFISASRTKILKRVQNDDRRKAAFTLAEVLITLGIIGVVAAITMPVLMTNINDRVNFERHANIAYKVTQAMEQMRAHGKLVQYASTDAFVDELQKYLKIQKRCSASNIAECWPTETVIDASGEEYNVSDAKKRKNLLSNITTDDKDDNNVGLILADGASIILTYDNSKSPVDIGTRVTTDMIENPKGQKIAYTIKPTTESIDFMMDVNGKRKPNTEGKDIKSFKSAHFAKSGHPCDNGPEGCLWLVPTYEPVDCLLKSEGGTNTESEEYNKYCGSGSYSGWGGTTDYWAGAKKTCDEAGMTLPNVAKLQAIQVVKNQYTGSNALLSSKTEWFWSSEEGCEPLKFGGIVNFESGRTKNDNAKIGKYQVLCVGE